MFGWRLLLSRGVQGRDCWHLSPRSEAYLGRDVAGEPKPEVDLSPDLSVSRQHARLWNEGDQWWIEDAGSRNGTQLDGYAIEGQGPVPLEAGSEIQVGNTSLVLASPAWRRLRSGNIAIDIEGVQALNYSLVHCGIPPIERLFGRNLGAQETPAATLSFSVPGYAQAEPIELPALPGQSSTELAVPRFRFDIDGLQCLIEQKAVPLAARLGDSPLDGEDTSVWLLAHNEWSCTPEHWITLASFVLPNHPLVVEITHACSEAGHTKEALTRVHSYLSENWNLAYQREPPNSASHSQRVRLPHQVLLNCDLKRGHGTCIDFALLMAGCLEHMHANPVIAIVDLGESRHALVGSRLRSGLALETVIVDKTRLEGVAWLEPTHCTRRPSVDPMTAITAAEACLAERPLLFALDVAAARRDGIAPLPFAGEPQWSGPASQAISSAERVAASIGPLPTGAVHLLVGLLGIEDGMTQEVFRSIGLMPESAIKALQERLGQQRRTIGRIGRTEHFDQALAAAHVAAKRCGSPLATEGDLLRALAQVESVALDRALYELGTSRQQARAAVLQHAPTVGDQAAYSVFSEFSSAA